MINFDVSNLFNANTTEVFQRSYSRELQSNTRSRSMLFDPLSIMSARFFKVSAQIDF